MERNQMNREYVQLVNRLLVLIQLMVIVLQSVEMESKHQMRNVMIIILMMVMDVAKNVQLKMGLSAQMESVKRNLYLKFKHHMSTPPRLILFRSNVMQLLINFVKRSPPKSMISKQQTLN